MGGASDEERSNAQCTCRDDAQHVGACFQAFDDDDTDIVTVIVYQQVRGSCHAIRVPSGTVDAPGRTSERGDPRP
jgi:hypothetical protein